MHTPLMQSFASTVTSPSEPLRHSDWVETANYALTGDAHHQSTWKIHSHRYPLHNLIPSNQRGRFGRTIPTALRFEVSWELSRR